MRVAFLTGPLFFAATGATSKKEMGKVIGALKKLPEAALIDFGVVSKLVQAKLP